MYRLFKVGLLVAAAFAFTMLMMYMGRVCYFCAYLMWPGVAITLGWLHRPVPLGDNNFLPLSLFFNTLIYSALFGLLFKLLGFIRHRHRSGR